MKPRLVKERGVVQMKRVIALTVALVLVGEVTAVASSPGAGVTPAAAPAASIKVGNPQTKTKSAPYALRLTVRRPVLKGSTAKNRSTFTRAVTKLITAERKVLGARQSARCGTQGTAELEVSGVDAAVYKKRYASVSLRLRSRTGCEARSQHSVRAYTLDLQRGKAEKLSKFVAINDITTQLATIARLTKVHSRCVRGGDLRPRGTVPSEYSWTESSQPLPQHSAWSVSDAGLRLSYARSSGALSACGAVGVVVPWTNLVTPKQAKGKKRHQVFVTGLSYYRGDLVSGEVAIVTTQGRRVTVGAAGIDSEIYGCAFGVRRGAKARMFAEVDLSAWTLKFAGKGAKARAKIGEPYRQATAKERKKLAEFTAETGHGKLDAANYCFS